MTIVWILVGVVLGWSVASWLTGIANPWRSLWRRMRGHPIATSVVVVSIVLVVGQLAFGWFLHHAGDGDPAPCEAGGSQWD